MQPVAGVPEDIEFRLQLGGHPMLVRVASTAAQDEAQAWPASTSMQPDPATPSLKHPSVVTQI